MITPPVFRLFEDYAKDGQPQVVDIFPMCPTQGSVF
jgi:hypothetical protein